MDTDDRELLAASVEAALEPTAIAADNDAALVQLGWHEMLAAEPIDAVGVVFGRLGDAAAHAGVLDDVVGAALGLPPGAALVHPQWGGHRGAEREATNHVGVAGDRIRTSTVAHVVCRDGVAAVDAAQLDISAPAPDRRLSTVTIGGPLDDGAALDARTVDGAVLAARRAIGHQLRGLAAGMLALARQHAVDRIQFGRPIGTFQAVRHKLAETHVAIEGAAAALEAADHDPSALTVDLARVLAGRAAIDAGRHCQQVLAGIGFTRDHEFHRYLFAAIELDGLYGTTAGITKQLGRQLISDRRVPRTVDL